MTKDKSEIIPKSIPIKRNSEEQQKAEETTRWVLAEKVSTITLPKGHGNNGELYVGFKRLSDGAIIPTKAHANDSGFDLYASEDVIIEPGETALVPTGIAVQLPEGCEAQVRPKSGITSKTKLRVQLGTVDNGYTGEVKVIVDNVHYKRFSESLYGIDGKPVRESTIDYSKVTGSYLIRKGDKIAQLVVQYLPQVTAVEIVEIDGQSTSRGEGGFGSTGVRHKKEESD